MNNFPLVLYGAGGNALHCISDLRLQGHDPVCFCDNDPLKRGRRIAGLDILSLDEIKSRYPVFNIFVTPNPPVKFEICYSLIEQGISKDNIVNFEEQEYRIGCSSLENCMLIFNKRFHYCCGLGSLHNAPPQVAMPEGDMKNVVDAFIAYRDQLIAEIQDFQKENPCKGCPELKWGYYPVQRKIRSISFSSSYPCNLKCTYCDVRITEKDLTREERDFLKQFDFAELIKELERAGHIGEICPIEISAGEITINPRCDEILGTVANYPVLLFSNCVNYNQKVELVIKRPDSFLIESVDSGTRETYAKIKGRDVFDTVVENIRLYSKNGGNIQLKYIVTMENANDSDLHGFLNICREIKPQKVRISCDVHNDFSNLPQLIVDFASRLSSALVEEGHEVLVLDHFGKYTDCIKEAAYIDTL